MSGRLVLTLVLLIISFVILFISITQTAQVKYSFNGQVRKINVLGDKDQVEYYFPYTGILPDSLFWPLKAIRDRVWTWVTPSAQRRAELNLLFANKRIVSSKLLFGKDKPELGLSVLTKAERYLEDSIASEEIARSEGQDTKSFLLELSKAALKHRELIQDVMMMAPDDARPEIAKVEELNKNLYSELESVFNEQKLQPPTNPFD